MLTTLRIRNLALVDDLTLELGRGYCAVTGETGAGKSILIGALDLLVGGRADRTLIRNGAESCVVEAAFDIRGARSPLAAFLAEQGLEPCEDGLLLLKRSLSAGGGSRQFVNGSPTTVAVLARLGEWLVDMHGPHDHQSLLAPARQLAILDAYAGLGDQLKELADLLSQRAACQREREGIALDDAAYAQQLDLLRHQAREIEAAQLQPGDEIRVEEEFTRAHHAARLLQQVQHGLDCLDGEGESVLLRLGELGRVLLEMRRLDPAAGTLTELQEQISGSCRELLAALGSYGEKLELDPAQLQAVEERMNLVQALKRKYGPTAADILEAGRLAREKLNLLEQRDVEMQRLGAELARLEAAACKIAAQLTEARRAALPKLSKLVQQQLEDLGFRRSHFEIQLAAGDAASQPVPDRAGWDRVEFLFAPNIGEPPRPLRAIASSGEMARVMLALKTVLAAEDEVLLLVFDEVDANVGGETAGVVGQKMRRIAARHQVLCITHLAPVAAAADSHFEVSKCVKDGRSVTQVQLLTGRARTAELARMLGGQGTAALRHAEELEKNAQRS